MRIGDGNFPNRYLGANSCQELSKGERHKGAPVVAAREVSLAPHAEEREGGRAQQHDAEQLHHGDGDGVREVRQHQLAHHVAGRAGRVPRQAQRHHHQRLAPRRVHRHASFWTSTCSAAA